jgi:hypothetical protein
LVVLRLSDIGKTSHKSNAQGSRKLVQVFNLMGDNRSVAILNFELLGRLSPTSRARQPHQRID